MYSASMNLSIADIEQLLRQRYGGKPRFTWYDPATALEAANDIYDLTRESVLVKVTWIEGD